MLTDHEIDTALKEVIDRSGRPIAIAVMERREDGQLYAHQLSAPSANIGGSFVFSTDNDPDAGI